MSNATMTRTTISEATGFDQGDRFTSEAQVRTYFTIANIESMFGTGTTATAESLAEMADAVIRNGWHMHTTPEAVQAIRDAHATAAGSWTGCDWTTDSPAWCACPASADCDGDCHQLDLDSTTAAEARERAADETLSGPEREAWETAVEILEEIESSAAEAEREGALALQAAVSGDLTKALEHAHVAESRENEYGDAPTWRPLVTAIEEAIEARDNAEDADAPVDVAALPAELLE